MGIQIRRGTDAQWEAQKSHIVGGEPVIATDSERLFVGTGNGTFAEYPSTAKTGDVSNLQTSASTLVGAINELASEMLTAPISTSDIGNGAVTTDKIASGAVTNAKMATDSVDTANIVDNAITRAKIHDGVVNADKLANYSVTTAKIMQNAVTTDKIENYSVTGTKIANGTINPGNMSDNCYDTNDPQMDGIASPGASNKFARSNHVHPHDDSKANQAEVGWLEYLKTDNKNQIVGAINELVDRIDALGLSVVDGCLCVTYTE